MEKFDVIVLQDVPVLLQFNVLRNGQLLFARTPQDSRDFAMNVERRYEDESPYLDREAAITFERILSHRASPQ